MLILLEQYAIIRATYFEKNRIETTNYGKQGKCHGQGPGTMRYASGHTLSGHWENDNFMED